LELAGYSNILSKMVGSNNKLNNALATIRALASYKHADYFSSLKKTTKGEETEAVEEVVEKKAVKTEKVEKVEKAEKKPAAKKAPAKKPAAKKAPAKKAAEKTADKE
jgi:ribosomal protein S5